MPLIVGGRVTRRCLRKLDLNDGGFIDETVSGCVGNGVDNKRSNDSNELNMCEMTLKELKDICKAKRQKVSKSVGSKKQDSDLSSEQVPCALLKEEDSDLEETLSCWKKNLSKRPKVMRKHTRKLSFPESTGSVKDEQETYSFSTVGHDSMLLAMRNVPITIGHSQTGEVCTLNKIKSEVIETDSCNHQNMPCIADCSATTYFVKVNSSEESSAQLLERVGGKMETGESISFIAQVDSGDLFAELPNRIQVELGTGESSCFASKSHGCCVNEVSTQYTEPDESSDIIGGISKKGFSETTSQESLSPSTSKLKTENALNDPLSSGSPEALSLPKDLGSEIPDSSQNHSSPQEILYHVHYTAAAQMHDFAIDNLQCTELYDGKCVSDLETEDLEKIVDEVPIECVMSMENNKEDASDLADYSTSDNSCLYRPTQDSKETYETHGSYFSLQEISCQMDDNIVAQLCDMDINHCIRCMGLDDGNDVCPSDFESKGHGVLAEVSMNGEVPDKVDTVPDFNENTSEPDALYTPSKNSNLCFSVADCFHSLPVSEEMLMSSSIDETKLDIVDEAGVSSTKIDASNHTNELVATEVCALKAECPPEKLLSTRKAISPTSREKLRRAAEDYELRDSIKLSKRRKNLWLEKRTKNKVSSASCFEEAEFMTKKSKTLKNGSPPSVMNIAQPLQVIPCACMQCSWINEHARKAIIFSQRQMNDIESLAMRLTNRLKSMKNIFEDTLLSEACLSMPSKYTVDEIRDVTKETVMLEGSTRKWLAMMMKDCSRFCKIMALTTNKAACKVNGSHKEQRKVTFADEIGGTLCHVKILEGHPTSSHGH